MSVSKSLFWQHRWGGGAYAARSHERACIRIHMAVEFCPQWPQLFPNTSKLRMLFSRSRSNWSRPYHRVQCASLCGAWISRGEGRHGIVVCVFYWSKSGLILRPGLIFFCISNWIWPLFPVLLNSEPPEIIDILAGYWQKTTKKPTRSRKKRTTRTTKRIRGR